MTEFSRNILTEPMSRRRRAQVLGVQSVCAALSMDGFAEKTGGVTLRYEQPADGVGYTDWPTSLLPDELPPEAA